MHADIRYLCMKFFTLFLGLILFMNAFQAQSQQLSFEQLESMVTLPQRDIDTIMKKANYKLIQKEAFGRWDIVCMLFNSFIYFALGYSAINSLENGDQYLGLFI